MILRDNFLFENWTRLKLEKLTNLCNKRIFETGEYLFRQVSVRTYIVYIYINDKFIIKMIINTMIVVIIIITAILFLLLVLIIIIILMIILCHLALCYYYYFCFLLEKVLQRTFVDFYIICKTNYTKVVHSQSTIKNCFFLFCSHEFRKYLIMYNIIIQ